DEVKSAIPIDGQRMQIENSRDAVLEHWLDEGGVDLTVDYTPTDTDADQVRALIRDIAERAAEQDLTPLASRMRDDGTEPQLQTVTTWRPASRARGRDRPELPGREIGMVARESPEAVPVTFPSERLGEYLTFVREGDELRARFDADAAKGILEPMLAE